jgi:hypothetical protein
MGEDCPHLYVVFTPQSISDARLIQHTRRGDGTCDGEPVGVGVAEASGVELRGAC